MLVVYVHCVHDVALSIIRDDDSEVNFPGVDAFAESEIPRRWRKHSTHDAVAPAAYWRNLKRELLPIRQAHLHRLMIWSTLGHQFLDPTF